SSY
ncbi:phospholipase D family protein, partial [Vibrio parahaemolyticus V-223/04]